MQNDLLEIVILMNRRYNFDLSKYDEAFLKQTAERRCEVTKTDNLNRYLRYLADNETEAQNFAQSLNITYTEFFRNPLTFAHLEQWILPNLINKKTSGCELRVWSAGCSTGQEAYSVAMMLENELDKGRKAFRYRIIATDISESALELATRGEYREEAIQNIRIRDVNRFFEKTGETFIVSERLRNHISFSQYDLLDPRSANPQESIFGNFDIIICSNLLFYYNSRTQHFILKKLANALVGNGYLITGEAERHTVQKYIGLRVVAIPSPIFHKKMEVYNEN